MVVDVFIPCFIDQLYPETAKNMVKILEKAGVTCNYPSEQTCCGQMTFNSGYWDETQVVAEKFMDVFSSGNYVVAPSASCVSMVRNYYGKFFHNSARHLEYKKLKANIYEFTDFMVNVLKVTDLGATFNEKVTFHDSCAALREYGLTTQPRDLLSKVKGLEIVEMENNDVCCGFGGTFSIKHEEISTAMAEKKLEGAMATGAKYITGTEASCLLHLDGYITKHNLPIKTIHIVDILANF